MFSLYSLYICTTISYACPVLHDFIHTWCMYSDSYISIPHVLTTFMVFFPISLFKGQHECWTPRSWIWDQALLTSVGPLRVYDILAPSDSPIWSPIHLWTWSNAAQCFFQLIEMTPLHIVPSTPASLQGRLVKKVNESDMAETVKARGDGFGDLVKKTLTLIVKQKRCRQKNCC